MVMEIILKSGYHPMDIERKLLKVYIEIALPGYYAKLDEIMEALSDKMIGELEQRKRLAEILAR